MRRIGNPLTRTTSVHKFVRLVRILDRWVPVDPGVEGLPGKTAIIPVVSLRGFRGFKVTGSTHDRSWSVELYGGNFYLVKISGLEPSDFRIPLHVLNYLRSRLNLRHER